jgi:hypothetical protein
LGVVTRSILVRLLGSNKYVEICNKTRELTDLLNRLNETMKAAQ